MIKYRDECCDCAAPGYPCRGSTCPNRYVEHHYCDNCGDETKLYYFDGQELCGDCLLEQMEVVEGSE